MPRASYGDKHTVSVLKRDRRHEEEKHVAFDFTSAVVDFVLLGGEGTGGCEEGDGGEGRGLVDTGGDWRVRWRGLGEGELEGNE